MNFEIGKDYKRTKLHDEYGGNYQNGISRSRKYPLIFIFTDPFKKTDIYEDKWEDEIADIPLKYHVQLLQRRLILVS